MHRGHPPGAGGSGGGGGFARILLAASDGRHFLLSTAALSILGYGTSLASPAIRLWNDTHHVLTPNGQDAAGFYIGATSLQPTR